MAFPYCYFMIKWTCLLIQGGVQETGFDCQTTRPSPEQTSISYCLRRTSLEFFEGSFLALILFSFLQHIWRWFGFTTVWFCWLLVGPFVRRAYWTVTWTHLVICKKRRIKLEGGIVLRLLFLGGTTEPPMQPSQISRIQITRSAMTSRNQMTLLKKTWLNNELCLPNRCLSCASICLGIIWLLLKRLSPIGLQSNFRYVAGAATDITKHA